jgi:hypothetical protein
VTWLKVLYRCLVIDAEENHRKVSVMLNCSPAGILSSYLQSKGQVGRYHYTNPIVENAWFSSVRTAMVS